MKQIITIIISLLFSGLMMTGCTEKNEGRAKYIFLFIGDGMGFSHVAATESYLSDKAGKLGGEQVTFTEFPYHGSASNYSANSKVTDSAASGTAIATGVKTNNGMIGVDKDGNPAESVAEALHDDGYKVAIISSVPVNHATPSAFYAHNTNRSAYYDLTKEIPESGFEFFAGSGFGGYFGGKNKDQEGSDIWLEKNGINVCFSKEEVKEAIGNGDRMVVCQPYNKDREPASYEAGSVTPDDHILLSEMVEFGLEHLSDEEPFFMMCEGGEIDWAAHSQKTMPTVLSILAFDDAIKVAYRFYQEHPEETLIIVTADHGTGGISLDDPHWEIVDSAWTAAGKTNTLDRKENSILNDKAGIGWTTYGHTGDPVPMYAIGKGAERFSGRIDNTEIKGKILAE